jgi:prepilin-type N-terminal cleavage/methylation domain-containing protein
MKRHHQQKGFTLLELMVALTIAVILAMGAHAMLQAVLKARAMSDVRSAEFSHLQKAMWIIAQDLEQMDSHTFASPAGDYIASFSRKGEDNSFFVTYGFKDNTVTRYYWPEDSIGSEPKSQVLFKDINNFSIVTLSASALEVNLTSQTFGKLRRVIEITGN